jgi:hypothetical protein
MINIQVFTFNPFEENTYILREELAIKYNRKQKTSNLEFLIEEE